MTRRQNLPVASEQTADGRRQTADTTAPLAAAGETQGMERRDAVKLLAAASLAAVGIGAPDIARAAEHARAALLGGPAYSPVFFTAGEWPVVRSLADLVIPKDARSGSASDAGVPEFMDFLMNDIPESRKWMRDGLAWLNAECGRRFKKTWVQCTAAQQREVLDAIAFPKKAPAALKPGVEFFTRFRDLTSSGFWTSRIGIEDLGYMGNRIVPEWNGCPEPQLAKLGVSYKMSMHAVRRG
jgi:gluconate 2-dehydrogenase gamma chain